VGNNHRTSSIATRESIYLSEEQILTSLSGAAKQFGAKELAVLSTCNRCEVFGVLPEDLASDERFLRDLYLGIHEIAAGKVRSTSQDLAMIPLFSMIGLDAVSHAFKVAASLDSLVPGETQITGQFKNAMLLAKHAGTFGPLLDRLSQSALASAKSIRTNTDIGRHRVSISHAAVDLAKRASNDLSSLRFLIIGAGEMARIAAEYIAPHKPISLIVANRSLTRAEALIKQLAFGEHQGLENLVHLIAKADVVISATNAPGYIIDKAMVQRAIEGRSEQPLFLIDIALPRDIDPDCANVSDAYLFDIDDLKSVVDAHMEKRRDALDQALDILSANVHSFGQWLAQREVAPAISHSSRYFSDLMTREASKTFNRDLFANLNEKQREAIAGFINAVSSRITGDIAQLLKNASPEQARDMGQALQSLFNKKDPSP
jgi:glutamyl-tRNA reductase